MFEGKGRAYNPNHVLVRNERLWISGQLSSACVANHAMPLHKLVFQLDPKFSATEHSFPTKLEIELQGGFAARKCTIIAQVLPEDGVNELQIVTGFCWLADTSALQKLDIIAADSPRETKNRFTHITVSFTGMTDFYARIAVYYLNILAPVD